MGPACAVATMPSMATTAPYSFVHFIKQRLLPLGFGSSAVLTADGSVCISSEGSFLGSGTGLTACDARRFCPRQVRRQHRKVRRLNHPPLGLARSIGAVGPFRSPNLSSATPMTPATGVDAGAGKAGLIQSSATCPAGLECRKVLFRHKVTAIPAVSCTLFPASQIAREFAVGACGATVISGSSWRKCGECGTAEFASEDDVFFQFPDARPGAGIL